jgi:hypothetical protein
VGEELTLATITIDKDGVVRGVADMNRGLTQVERKFDDTSKAAGRTAEPFDALTHRMFNMRTAAAALLGGATLGGLILTISNLTSEIITNTGAWQEWKRAFDDAIKSVTEGETKFDAAARHIAASSKAAGINSLFAIPGQIDTISTAAGELIRRRNAIQEAVQGGAPPGTIGFPNAPQRIELEGINKELQTLFDVLYKVQQQSGLTEKEFNVLFGTTLGDPKDAKPAIKVLETLDGVLGDVVIKAQRLSDIGLFDKGPALREPGGAPLFLGEQTGGGFDVPGGDAVREFPIDKATDALKDLQDQQDEVIRRYDLIGNVAQIAGDAIVSAANAGVVSQKAATKALLLLTAVQSIQLGMKEKAAALASAAEHHWFEATLHWTAATLYFAAAAFNGSAAFSGGGGSGGGSGGPSELGRGNEESGRSATITVINQGTMIGNTPDQIVRWITEAQRRSGER